VKVPGDLRYSQDHEWVKVEGTTGRIGITDFAQDQLGDIVFVELPEVGRTVKAGEAIGVVESVKSVSDVLSPVSGKVTRVNGRLQDQPEVVNKDPYGEGWMVELELSDPAEVGGLLKPEDYERLAEGGDA
jgi:glycine cleavage system H protein